MDYLQALRTAAYLAEATQPRASRQPLLLRTGEMKEAQCQESRAVRQAALQLPPPAVGDLRQLDLAFHHRARSGKERPDLTTVVRSSYRSGSTKSRS